MGHFFDINGKVYRFLERVSDCIIVGFLWALFSLPFFTIGASTTALYYTYHRVIQNSSGKLWNTFWTTFRNNFKQALALWAIQVALIGFLLADCYICYLLSDAYPELKFMQCFFIVAVLFVIMWSQYWFAYISHISDPVKAVLKNTFVMCVSNLTQSLIMLVIVAICAGIIYVVPNGVLLLPCAPTICLLFTYRPLTRVFDLYWDIDTIEEN